MSFNQRMNKVWYIYTMEYYSAEENNDFLKFEVISIKHSRDVFQHTGSRSQKLSQI